MLTRRELRSSFRETSVVLYSVLLPLLLYPFLLWLMVTAMTFIEGQQEKRMYKVAYNLDILKSDHMDFIRWLEKQEQLNLRPLKEGEVADMEWFDVALNVSTKGPENSLRIDFLADRPVSKEAEEKLLELGDKFLSHEMEEQLVKLGYDKALVRPFLIRGVSRAGSSDIGGYLLGALLPIGLLVMIALGGAYPAIDTTAGERERGTWETLRSCGPSLERIIFSKYLFVSLVCCLSGVLNLFAMLVSIRSIIAPLLRDAQDITFQIGPVTLLVLLGGVVAVSFCVSAALLVCAIFARTFREGQALTTPMFMLIALPVLPLSDPSLEMTSSLAWIPLVNLALVWRQALQGEFVAYYLGITFLSLGAMVVASLWLGSRLVRNETLMSGQGIEPTWRGVARAIKGVFRHE